MNDSEDEQTDAETWYSDEKNVTEELDRQLNTKMFIDMGVQTGGVLYSCDYGVQIEVLEGTVNVLTILLRKVCQDLSLGCAVHAGIIFLKAVPCSRKIQMSAVVHTKVVNKMEIKRETGGNVAFRKRIFRNSAKSI